jgi:hypothetical protein
MTLFRVLLIIFSEAGYQWLTYGILTTWEVEIGRLWFEVSPGITPCPK